MTILDSTSSPPKERGSVLSASRETLANGHSLAHAIESKAQSLAEEAIHPVTSEDGRPLDNRMLLVLLACCYARQSYRSAEVAAAASNDSAFCCRCLGAPPTAGTICRFRGRNREALHACLVTGLRLQAQQKIEAGLICRIRETSLQDEAHRRITMAMFIDDLERDRNLGRVRYSQ